MAVTGVNRHIYIDQKMKEELDKISSGDAMPISHWTWTVTDDNIEGNLMRMSLSDDETTDTEFTRVARKRAKSNR